MKKNSTQLKQHIVQYPFTVLLISFAMLLSSSASGIFIHETPANEKVPNSCKSIRMQYILPVVLTPLNGNYSNGVSQLHWTSLQESNSNHFEIQRSVDGLNFTKIGQVKAKGSSDIQVDYSYKDVSSIAGINFYRLKLIDNDGAFQYSNIEAINVNIKGIKITGNYPGPFTDEVYVNISSAIVTPALLCLLDGNGKIFLSQQIVLSKGINKTTFNNLGNLHNGIYFIKIQAGNTVVTEKIIK